MGFSIVMQSFPRFLKKQPEINFKKVIKSKEKTNKIQTSLLSMVNTARFGLQ